MIRLLCAAVLSTVPSLAAANAASSTHHSIDAKLDPASGRLEVTDIVTVRGRAVLEFRLGPWITVEGLELDGRSAEVLETAGSWRLKLPDTGEHRIAVRLHGVVPPLPPSDVRGPPPSAASGPEGSYLPGFAGWFPLTGDDWIAYRLAVEVPAPHRAVATGRLEEEAPGEKTNRAVFAADYPAEPPALFAGPYTVEERHEDGIRIRTYFHAELADLSTDYMRESGRFLRRYHERIGPYPFPDFHVISSPLPVGLGFPNLAYVGRTVLPLPFMRGRSLAHEVLHNWWGNGVAVDHATGNWAEGLTTYMADYALAEEQGGDPAREMRLGWLRDYAALPAERDVPVTAFAGKRHDAGQVVGYNKVAFIFHMLRQELGDAAFSEGLRLYWWQQRSRIAGWAELRQAFEAASERDLGWFFEQWLARAGAPRLRLGDVRSSSEGDASRITLSLHQDPPAYRLGIPVTIDTEAGELRRRIVLEQTAMTEIVTLPGRPTAVRLDPGHDLFRRLLPGESPPILRDVTLSHDTVLVVATDDAAMADTARRLAGRLLQRDVLPYAADPSEIPAGVPVLVIGAASDVAALRARLGIRDAAPGVAASGTARAWTEARAGGSPSLLVSANDADSLASVLRPLPHYRSRSWVVFEGATAADKGVWPVTASPLIHRFDD
jgi:hypothetical protein